MKIIQSFLTKNPCYKAGKKITVKGLMLHSVGCPQPKASVFINNWNRASFGSACVHGFIDGNDGTVYQTLPWNHRGWHGGGSSNNTHIGVEMCEPGCIKYTGGSSFTCSDLATAQAVAKRTYDSAVELFAMLCKQYGLDPMKDICSHREGHAKGIASNHGDPEHLWKGLGMGLTMDTFRQAVKAKMGGTAAAPAPSVSGDTGAMTDAEMFAFFKSQGLTDCGAAGLMGNLKAESGLIANNLQDTSNAKLGMTDAEYTAAVDNGTYTNFIHDGGGYGLAQWTYWSRKQELQKFMKAAGVSIGHKRKQCEFLMKELASSFPAVLQTLKTAKTVREASDAVLLKFEKPANQSVAVQKNRAGFGQDYYDRYAGGSSAALPYLVQITASTLNVRKGPGTGYAIATTVKQGGVYTIVEESNGWGKLKSGAGWISLAYAKKR